MIIKFGKISEISDKLKINTNIQKLQIREHPK